jgi:hypothetical protein
MHFDNMRLLLTGKDPALPKVTKTRVVQVLHQK